MKFTWKWVKRKPSKLILEYVRFWRKLSENDSKISQLNEVLTICFAVWMVLKKCSFFDRKVCRKLVWIHFSITKQGKVVALKTQTREIYDCLFARKTKSFYFPVESCCRVSVEVLVQFEVDKESNQSKRIQGTLF